MRRPTLIAVQSSRPTGLLGWIVGQIMSRETVPMNTAVLAALDLASNHRVLEVGFGHGRTLRRVAEIVPDGFVGGVDYSQTMLNMASRRCQKFLEAGTMVLKLGDSANLPFPEQYFDRVFSVHTIYFWKDPESHLHELHRVLRPGGRLVLGFREKAEGGGTENYPESVYTFRSKHAVRQLLLAAGLVNVSEGNVSGLHPGSVVLVAQAGSQSERVAKT